MPQQPHTIINQSLLQPQTPTNNNNTTPPELQRTNSMPDLLTNPPPHPSQFVCSRSYGQLPGTGQPSTPTNFLYSPIALPLINNINNINNNDDNNNAATAPPTATPTLLNVAE
eukprot:397742_1